MTVSPDARTPSATVHALSGSSAPGAGAVMQPFGIATAAVHELPDTFAPLGAVASNVVAGLAARRAAAAHPDAEVIDLAGRVVALNRRENRLVLRTVEIEDAVFKARPPRPEKAEGTLRIVGDRSIEHDGTRVTTIREPAGWSAEFRANHEAHEVALAEREHIEQAEEVRRGLPRWNKLRERATCRLERWGLQLAAMEPTTQAGLKAKAAASTAVAEGDELPDDWRQKLAISLGRDALRIIGAECDVRAEQDRQADGELFALLSQLATATDAQEVASRACDDFPEGSAAYEAACQRCDEATDRMLDAEERIHDIPARTLAGLRAKANVELIYAKRANYHSAAIDFLREVAAFTPSTLPQSNIRPAPLPAGIPAGRYPAGVPREVIENYRTFLDMELRYLNHEVYGQTEGRMHLWLDNPAGRLHGPSEPPASSRAAAVLRLLGIMPDADAAAVPAAASAA